MNELRPETLITRNELARRLGASPDTLWRWSRDGHGPPVLKLATGRVRYRESDVLAFMVSLTTVEPVG